MAESLTRLYGIQRVIDPAGSIRNALENDLTVLPGNFLPFPQTHDQPWMQAGTNVDAVHTSTAWCAVLLLSVCGKRVAPPAVNLAEFCMVPVMRKVWLTWLVA